MTIKVAINGFGRIGRNIIRALYESHRHDEMTIVAINDMANLDTLAYLLKYDSICGHFSGDVSVDDNRLIINGNAIEIFSKRDPQLLPWKKLGVDVVHECTGLFTDGHKASAHLTAGAKKVLISAPAKNVDATIVFGVNHQSLTASHKLISNASCTTNCLAPLIKPLHETVGIVKGLMTTVHAYTNDQSLQDAPHQDKRRARAAALSMIPTKTGAAAALGLVLPQLGNCLDGFAIRVPSANVSIVDVTFEAKCQTSVAEINQILYQASQHQLAGVLCYNDLPLVSIDFNHNPASSIVDAPLTKVIGDNLVKVSSWYDNEWGFSNRMLDTTMAMMKAI